MKIKNRVEQLEAKAKADVPPIDIRKIRLGILTKLAAVLSRKAPPSSPPSRSGDAELTAVEMQAQLKKMREKLLASRNELSEDEQAGFLVHIEAKRDQLETAVSEEA